MSIKPIKVLIIEDNWMESEYIETLLNKYLKKHDVTSLIRRTATERESYEALSRERFDLVVFDIDLDDPGAGLRLLKQFSDEIGYSVMSTARQKDEVVELAYKIGCEDYIHKPIKKEKIENLVKDFVNSATQRIKEKLILSKYITQDEYTKKQILKISNVGDATVLLNGPTGVGKQVIAELVHEIHNSDKKFLEQNCSAIEDSLATSFLFGHMKGSFTGAVKDQTGIFEKAKGGTVFLDEIDKTSVEFQAKLLKVIEQKKVQPIGSDKSIEVDFKLITAASKDLAQMVEDGEFLPDLWERLQGETILLKPLCERPEDISYQLKRFMKAHQSGRLFSVSAKAMKVLSNYDWPGNSRELKNVVDKFQRRKVKVVELEHLGFLRSKSIRDKYKFANTNILKAVKEDGLSKIIEDLTREIIEYSYEQNFKNTRKTLRQLDISTRVFYKHMEQQQQQKEVG